MKINQFLTLGAALVFGLANAQTPQVQGIPHEKGRVAAKKANAIEYVDWVDWDQIQHWAGDPDGKNKTALVIDFQDGLSDCAYVWGYRWNGTATGEDLVRAVASQSSCLIAMIQYTGTMGSTLNGLGLSPQRSEADFLSYDFDRAAIAGEVSFGYFTPNTTMGQEVAPGYEAEQMCKDAIENARESGIIEHPLNAFVYGYPAYDYDYWQLDENFREDALYRWKAGWYDGYWSYWHGPNDYDYLSYSGLGMSSTQLVDGYVQVWKYTPINGGGFGETGGELAQNLEYEMLDYEESMGEAPVTVQPVDQSKVNFWVGEGEKSATVVFQFNDGKGPENIVYGYKWSGGWDDSLTKVVNNIIDADPRLDGSFNGTASNISFDSDHNGVFTDAKDHTALAGQWNCYVKRTVDASFNRVNPSRWLNPDAVLIVSCQQPDESTVSLPYQLFRPALDSDQLITIPDSISYALDDNGLNIPIFIQVPEDAKMNSGFTCSTKPSIVTAVQILNFMGKVSAWKNFSPTVGDFIVRGSYTPAGQTKAVYAYSNACKADIKAPLRPVTSISFEQPEVESALKHAVDNKLIITPADATYTKVTLASSDRTVATVSGLAATTTAKAGSSVITATYDYDNSVTASYTIDNDLRNPVVDVTFEGVEDDVITLTPKEMLGLFPVVSPENADIKEMNITLSDNGTAKDNYIATTYKVQLWDKGGNRTSPFELSGHRVGQCRLIVHSMDGCGFSKEFTVNIVEPERTPAIDYTTGTIMLNEEWYGHTNGGLNWYSPDYEITYQAYERENPGMSFGATSQYGIIYDGKLIVMSKQDVDGGDPLPGGGRIVIADAATLKRLGSINDIKFGDETKSQDGRAVVGAGTGRVYAGTNNGVYIIDTNSFEIIGKVGGKSLEGDQNDRPNSDPSSSLYQGQIGDMVLAGHHVFVTRQDNGVYIVDIDTDQVVKIIEDKEVQGITQSADGRVWYTTLSPDKKQSLFVALDINTLEEDARIEVPAEFGAVTCGWGAWRTTQFTGAHSVNALFFCPGSSITNGGGGVIYRYDIDDNKFTRIAQVSGLPAHTEGVSQGAYGTIRYDDRTGEIIAGTTEFKASGHYRYNWTHFIDAQTGEFLRTVELRPYYWFQAHAIFPDAFDPEVEDIDDITLNIDDDPLEISVNATDRDNNDANIRYSLIHANGALGCESDAKSPVVDVAIDGNKLTVTPQSAGRHTIALAVESNGKVVNHAINVEVLDKTSGLDLDPDSGRRIFVGDNAIHIQGYAGVNFQIVNIAGQVVDEFCAADSLFLHPADIAPGVYLLVSDNGISKKIIIK